MIRVLGIISVCFLILTIIWTIRICYVGANLYRARRKKSLNKSMPSGNIYILLPVLNEDIRLPEFVDYYTSRLLPTASNLRLIIITTERETLEYPSSKTIEVAKAFAYKHPTINHIHYPNTHGVMAHQLNFAIQNIPDMDFVAIYNADSRPEPKTFEWMNNQISDDSHQIFQQYGIYTKNLPFIKKQQWSATLVSNAYWQCRWAIGFEYYHALAASKRPGWPSFAQPFNYCIGHGLFIKSSLIKKIKFSESTTNEDAILGVKLSDMGLSPTPIPYFDTAESPDSIESIYKQKSIWFQGPFQAFIYRNILTRHSQRPIILLLNCSKLFSHAIYWIVGPIGVVITLILSIFISLTVHPIFIIMIASPLIFLVIPPIACWLLIKKLRLGPTHINIAALTISLIIGGVPAYVTHGAAGIRGVIIYKKLLQGFKQKTKMRQYKEI